MNRNFYRALVASVFVHALLLILVLSTGGDSVDGVASTQPPLSYTLEMPEYSSPVGKVLDDAEPVAPAPIEETLTPKQQVPEVSTPAVEPERQPILEEQAPVQLAEEKTIDVEELLVEATTATVSETVDPPATELDIVTALVPDDPSVTLIPPRADESVSAKQELSRKQQKMLNKKLRKWTESFPQEDLQDANMVWEHKGQEYTAKFHSQEALTDTNIDRVTVEISTEENGQTVSTTMRMKRLAFSSFAQFVNRWDPNVQLHDDELDGRFHANSAISIQSSRGVSPTFHGKVTTAARKVDVRRKGGSAARGSIFLGGLETGVRRIGLPKRYNPLASHHSADEEQIHRINGDTRIVFHANGTYDWGPVDESTVKTRQMISDATTYIVGERNTKLFVSGTVKGKVMVRTPENIVIEQDLLYAHDPAITPDGENFLGLVSDKNVEIALPNVTGPGDLRIYASIFAKRKFSVRRYRTKQDSMLFIYGSVTAGALTATEPRYHTKIVYDPRLEELRAPGFPLTNHYEIISWDRQWSSMIEDDSIE